MIDELVQGRYRDGTRRAVFPEETLARVLPLAPVMGITRLGNVTGLDNIGIPVVMACRPNARSLSVSQGKGLTLAAAKASALMECVELYHAESVSLPLRLGSVEELQYSCTLVDLDRLPRSVPAAVSADRPILWVEGARLERREPVWVPYEVVHLDFTDLALPETGCLLRSSNGLASGNHPLEAISHALSELVERDAMLLFDLASDAQRAARRVDLSTVDDAGCLALLERFAAVNVAVAVWGREQRDLAAGVRGRDLRSRCRLAARPLPRSRPRLPSITGHRAVACAHRGRAEPPHRHLRRAGRHLSRGLRTLAERRPDRPRPRVDERAGCAPVRERAECPTRRR